MCRYNRYCVCFICLCWKFVVNNFSVILHLFLFVKYTCYYITTFEITVLVYILHFRVCLMLAWLDLISTGTVIDMLQ